MLGSSWKSRIYASFSSLSSILFRRSLALFIGAPLILFLDAFKAIFHLLPDQISVATSGIDESEFANEDEFRRIVNRLGEAPARTTGSRAHNDFIEWIEQELGTIPGIIVKTDEYNILRWQVQEGTSLKDAGNLTINNPAKGTFAVPIAGVVPFSLSTSGHTGQLLYLPRSVSIAEAGDMIKGKVLLRDFPASAIPYSTIFLPSYARTTDLNWDLGNTYDRPGLADEPLKEELIAAGKAGAVAMIIMFDVKQSQVESYFEPHQGVHYKLPAMFVGADEAAQLKANAAEGATAAISVQAEVCSVPTRNVIATLPGQTTEQVMFVTHTDGNTFIQENGAAAVLTLAQYYSRQPLSSRRRTIQFAFNTGHLHISQEGTARHAEQLNDTFDNGNVALVIPVEHLGTREIEAVPRSGSKPGRELRFSGRGEMMFWCVGPSASVLKAVKDAVKRRKLDRTLITRGTCMPDPSRVPTFTSFGGIGTYYHNLLVPTTSLISGPWSLWAPYFGSHAVDISRLRAQTLAVGDVYLAIDKISQREIVGGYSDYRRRRANGTKTAASLIPPEIAPDAETK